MNSILGLFFRPLDWLLYYKEKSNQFLERAFAPMEHETTGECEIEGILPETLEGEFARVGPNPRFAPRGSYHWFDGDGMVHAVRIKDGRAIFSNRFIRTAKLAREEAEGHPVFITVGELSGVLAIPRLLMHSAKKMVGYINPKLGSPANTALEFHAGRLMALWEGGLPYGLKVLCDGVIETIGEMTLDGKYDGPFTAHPKKDPATGKLYGFGYRLDARPYVTFFVLDHKGNVERQFPLLASKPTVMHDFAISETHAVFMETCLMFEPKAFVSGVIPLIQNREENARIGVLPLDAKDDSSMRWFDTKESFVTFHLLNAWNVPGTGDSDPEKMKIVSCDTLDFNIDLESKITDVSQLSRVYTTTVDFNTGEVTRELVITEAEVHEKMKSYDFPQFRKSMIGRSCRYGFFAEICPEDGSQAVIKVDLQATSPDRVFVGRIEFGEGMVGGECPFIPANTVGGDEDDGYIATFVGKTDGTGTSELCVWNAKTMDPKPVARVKLPQRVPLGFHATFLSEEELGTQISSQ